jgi:hypothetical protein
MVIAVVVVVVVVVLVALGRGDGLSVERNDYLQLDLGPLSATDVALLRPPTGLWGYNMQATDEAMEQIAESIRERDIRIVALEQLVTDLSKEPATPLSSPYVAARHRRAALDPVVTAPSAPPPSAPPPLAPAPFPPPAEPTAPTAAATTATTAPDAPPAPGGLADEAEAEAEPVRPVGDTQVIPPEQSHD